MVETGKSKTQLSVTLSYLIPIKLDRVYTCSLWQHLKFKESEHLHSSTVWIIETRYQPEQTPLIGYETQQTIDFKAQHW